MDINTLRSIATVICFALFLGIIWWAYRGKNRAAFDEAAMLPFALDEADAQAKNFVEGKQP